MGMTTMIAVSCAGVHRNLNNFRLIGEPSCERSELKAPSRQFVIDEIRRIARRVRALRAKRQDLHAIEIWSLREDLKGLIALLETHTDFPRVEAT
jgi:hypothetical protein